MFERFTDRARRVVVLAQEEARMLNHNYIGTEHILLGLIREGEGVAAQVLVKLGADLNRVRNSVNELLGAGEGGEGAGSEGAAPPITTSTPFVDALERIVRVEQKIDALSDSVAEILRRLSGPASGRGPGGRSRP